MNPPPSIAVVVSRYNADVTSRLLEAAIAEIVRQGGASDRIAIIDAPGAFELTALCNAAARSGAYRGIVALGCLIHGQTRHDRYIADAVAQGIARITIDTGVPVAFGLITAETPEQAHARSGGDKGNKGQEAAAALMDTLTALDAIERAIARGMPCDVERLATAAPRDKSRN